MVLCFAYICLVGCGGGAPDEAAGRAEEAQSLSGPKQMQNFLAAAQSKLASQIGRNVLTESPVAVAAAIKGGKSAEDYEGRTAVWTGAVLDFDLNAGRIMLRCPDKSDVVTVSLALQPTARGNMPDVGNALGVVFCGTVQSATDSSHDMTNGFVSAMWLESGQGKEYSEITKAAINILKPQ